MFAGDAKKPIGGNIMVIFYLIKYYSFFYESRFVEKSDKI